MSSGFWNTTLTQSTSRSEDLWTVMPRTELFWDIHDIMCFNSARCCRWWMDLQYSPLNTISHMTACKVIFKEERDVWSEPRTSYTLIGIWETELDLIVCGLSVLPDPLGRLHPPPAWRDEGEEMNCCVQRGGLSITEYFLIFLFYPHFILLYMPKVCCLVTLCTPCPVYYLNTTNPKPALDWLWLYATIKSLYRNSTGQNKTLLRIDCWRDSYCTPHAKSKRTNK